MNIAVFADLHGCVTLCFLLCARWERETGERLDAIWQAGDLGALDLDVVLTHDAPLHSVYPESDLDEVGMILDTYKPRYHFYGHTEEPYRERLYTNGVTTTRASPTSTGWTSAHAAASRLT